MVRATGKDHAEINLDIWGDDDWLDLTPHAQHLYFVLWTSPQLSYCGTGEWHAGRIASKARGWTAAAVEAAAEELSRELFLIIDTATEEFILRSWIKHDGIWKKPNMAVSMANARAALASRTLRAVIVHEVAKIKTRNIAEASAETPISSSWQRDAVKNLLSQKAINPATLTPFTPSLTPAVTPGPTPHLTPPLTVSSGVGVNPPPDPTPTPAPAPFSCSISPEGLLSKGTHQSAETDTDPPPINRCPKHANDPSPPPCGACADARRHTEDRLAQRRAMANELRSACVECLGLGWVLDDDGEPVEPARKCRHTKAREALAHA